MPDPAKARVAAGWLLRALVLLPAFALGAASPRVDPVTGMTFSLIPSPSHFAGCSECPVERVSFRDIQVFLQRLNAMSPWPGFRLPTEAEWEYACRAGGHDAYVASATIDKSRANYDGAKTLRVRSFPANAFGLHDMSGNVWEWTSDDHCPYPNGHVTDPIAVCGSGLKVIRGGSWFFGPDSARCGLRYTHRPQDSGFSLGVRLAHRDE